MSRQRILRILSSSTIAAATVLLSQNCARTSFSSPTADEKSTVNTTGTTTTTTVCNPFGGSSTASPGIVAQNIYYVDTAALPSGTTPETVIGNSVEGFFNSTSPYVGSVNSNIFLSWINFPAMYFAQGFTDSHGTALATAGGTLLDEYFGLRLKSSFVPGSWAPGDYQIAIITDDGSKLTLAGGQADGSDLSIDNDGEHSMRLGCATGVLHVNADSHFDMTFDYFQGPRVTIGLMMLYRPVSLSGGATEPLCGQGGSSDTYFFLDHDSNNQALSPPISQAPYLQLTGAFDNNTGTGGWQVVEAEHFKLPSNVQNTCQ